MPQVGMGEADHVRKRERERDNSHRSAFAERMGSQQRVERINLANLYNQAKKQLNTTCFATVEGCAAYGLHR